jgi:hypothetical protein
LKILDLCSNGLAYLAIRPPAFGEDPLIVAAWEEKKDPDDPKRSYYYNRITKERYTYTYIGKKGWMELGVCLCVLIYQFHQLVVVVVTCYFYLFDFFLLLNIFMK